MAEIDITICNREDGCKSQFGEFGFQADLKVQEFADYQDDYMQNNTNVKPTCSQICGVLKVKLSEVDIPGKIITGVEVSGIAKNGKVLNRAPGVAFVDADGHFRTKLV